MNESEYSIYQLLINELIDFAKSIEECVSLVQIGSIKHPGLSDLDVIFLYNKSIVDGDKIEGCLKTIRNKYPIVPLDVWHIPFDQFGMYKRIFYVSKEVLLWGYDSKKNIDGIDDMDRVMLFLLQTPVKVSRVSALLSYPNNNPRIILLLLSSLRYSIDLCLKTFAQETGNIKKFYKIIEDLRDDYLINEFNAKSFNQAFILFSEIWNDLMHELSVFIVKKFPDIKRVVTDTYIYHPVSASGICCFKIKGVFSISSKYRPNYWDRFLSNRFGETLFGISIVELPMEALFLLINFKNQSKFLGKSMFFYNCKTIYNKYPEMGIIKCDQAKFADYIYSFYKKNSFNKGFPIAHYYNVGIGKKIKITMGKYKTKYLKKHEN